MFRTVVLVAALSLSGCYKTNIVNLSEGGSPGDVQRVWSHALIAGLIPLTEVDARSACGDRGVWAISTRQNFWQLLLTGLTGAIYTPTTAKITCKS